MKAHTVLPVNGLAMHPIGCSPTPQAVFHSTFYFDDEGAGDLFPAAGKKFKNILPEAKSQEIAAIFGNRDGNSQKMARRRS